MHTGYHTQEIRIIICRVPREISGKSPALHVWGTGLIPRNEKKIFCLELLFMGSCHFFRFGCGTLCVSLGFRPQYLGFHLQNWVRVLLWAVLVMVKRKWIVSFRLDSMWHRRPLTGLSSHIVEVEMNATCSLEIRLGIHPCVGCSLTAWLQSAIS